MKVIRKLAACLAALLLCMGLPVQAEQLDYIDLDHPASLRFEVHTPQGDPVPGGTITIYKVANIVQTASGYEFEAVPEFTGIVTNERLNEQLANHDLDVNHELSRELMEYAQKQKYAGESEQVPETGIADFSTAAHDISLGLWLVTQPEAAPGYEAMPPFLISLPRAIYTGDSDVPVYEYDVVATPKSDPKKLPATPPKNDPPQKPSKTPTFAETGWMQYTGLLLLSLVFIVLLLFNRRKENR
ncbi:hypothetical protein [Faecalibaculum rodentium]|uniref:hypothetical protein n=1 Tax=Faecalibaculum rodentium TaxID=1702221 RepID=UPI00272B7F05|nr:hypothetical protein [Faecalibaculum rodentium]